MMMMSGRAGGGATTAGRYPFTASQWQELEHQALIYKCLASGKPIPSYLMPPLRRILDSALATSPSLAFPPQPSLGWGCFGMGFTRKPDEDPEPGRCRRTDGKKWRCSKEAYPDSKYCEKHMHRGKNRSRKPVEMSLATPAPPASAASSATSATATAATTTSSPAPSYHHRPAPAAHDAAPYHALYGGGGSPYSASSARPAGGAGAYHHHGHLSPFHPHLETTHPHPPPSYYSVDQRDYAYGHATKEVVGEHAFFSDGGAAERDRQHAAGQWQFKQLGMDTKPSPTSLFPIAGYGNNGAASPYGVDLGAKEDEEEERRRQQQQHCFVLGADLRLERPSGHDAAPAQKPLRPFFDEWPHEKGNKAGSWMGLDGETQLSMSIPMAANDLPVTSRYRNDE